MDQLELYYLRTARNRRSIEAMFQKWSDRPLAELHVNLIVSYQRNVYLRIVLTKR